MVGFFFFILPRHATPHVQQAVKRGAVSVLEALVDPARGALDVASAGRGGNLLTRAADPEVPTEVARILVDAGCTVNAANEHCGLPLHRAVLNTRVRWPRVVVGSERSGREQRAMSSVCTYMPAFAFCALYPWQADLVRLLIDAGADIRAQWRYGNV